jgi:hypothetical protein
VDTGMIAINPNGSGTACCEKAFPSFGLDNVSVEDGSAFGNPQDCYLTGIPVESGFQLTPTGSERWVREAASAGLEWTRIEPTICRSLLPRSGRRLIVELLLTMWAGRRGRLNAAGSHASRPGRSSSLPVAFGAELDVQRAQILPPKIVQRRELVLAARVVQPPDREFVTLTVDQPEEPPGGQGLGNVSGDCLAGPGLADCGRLGPVVAGDRILGDNPAVRRGQWGEFRDQWAFSSCDLAGRKDVGGLGELAGLSGLPSKPIPTATP